MTNSFNWIPGVLLSTQKGDSSFIAGKIEFEIIVPSVISVCGIKIK